MRNIVAATGAHVSPLKLDTQKNPSCDVKFSFVVLKGQTLRAIEDFYGWNLK